MLGWVFFVTGRSWQGGGAADIGRRWKAAEVEEKVKGAALGVAQVPSSPGVLDLFVQRTLKVERLH